ncbi:hypothetical protein Ahy_A06g027005 isoform C [Arachis hypogaea]|uniref:Uncharacterized protein n=1 Tax=Arachis hypogaea TaxID=3818 RepID=A0A445CMB1_ARAHY|nr:hypothetical protein Ahy_A06g027005 isoform C [Arachis hypogaea]
METLTHRAKQILRRRAQSRRWRWLVSADWFPYDLSPEKTIAFMIVGENPTALVVGVSYVRRRVFALNLPHYLSRIQGG